MPDTGRCIRLIEVRNEIVDFGIVAKRLKPVRKTGGHKQLMPIFRAEFECFPCAECFRPPAQIDDDVDYPTSPAAHDLGFLVGMTLKVHSSHRATVARNRPAMLDKSAINPMRRKFSLAIRPFEKAAIIPRRLRNEQKSIAQFCSYESHRTCSTSNDAALDYARPATAKDDSSITLMTVPPNFAIRLNTSEPIHQKY